MGDTFYSILEVSENSTPEEIKKYDLEIQSYSQEQDVEERDFSTEP